MNVQSQTAPSNQGAPGCLSARIGPNILTIGFAVAVAGCASTYEVMPNSPHYREPTDGSLRGASLSIDVRDKRDNAADSAQMTARVRDDVGTALVHHGATVLAGVKPPVTAIVLEIRYLRADFSSAHWTGCVNLDVALVDPSADDVDRAPRERVARCVRKFNWWGYGTAKDAIDDAYAEAIADAVTLVHKRIATTVVPVDATRPPLHPRASGASDPSP